MANLTWPPSTPTPRPMETVGARLMSSVFSGGTSWTS